MTRNSDMKLIAHNFGGWSTLNSNISAVLNATEKLLYAKEASTQDDSKTPPTFIPSSKFRGATAFTNKGQFFLGHPVCVMIIPEEI